MDMREQARHQALVELDVLRAGLERVGEWNEEEWDAEQGCEFGWDFSEDHPAATVEEVCQEAARQLKGRGWRESFRLSFISAALGGVEGLIR